MNINKCKVTIEWTDTTYTYDGNAHGVTVKVKGVGGETVGYTLSTNSYTAAGNYTVKVNSLSNANYTLDGVSNTSTTLTINHKLN